MRWRSHRNIWPVLRQGAHTHLALASAPAALPLHVAPEAERGCLPESGALTGYTFFSRPWLYTNIDECRNSLFSHPFTAPTPCDFLPIHLYWRQSLRPWGRLQAISIMSLLATQDLNRTRIYLWTDDEAITNSVFLRPLLDRVAVVRYSAAELARGTVLENWAGLDVKDERAYLDGDLFRILVLHRYGGIYVDTDVIALRDFAPLLTYEWAYQWGGWGGRWPESAEKATRINGAVLRMRPGSPALVAMMHELHATPIPTQSSTEWGRFLYQRVLYRTPPSARAPWPVILPVCYIDPEWWGGEEYRWLLQADKVASNLHLESFAYHFHFSAMVRYEKDEVIRGSRFERFELHVWELFCARNLSAAACRNQLAQ